MSKEPRASGPDPEGGGKLTFVLGSLLALVFLGAGIGKLAGASFIVDSFIRWGYPYWFVYPVGLIEIVGAAGLMARNLSFHASAALGFVMLVAFGTHISAEQYGMALAPLLLLLGLAFITYGRQMVRLGKKDKAKKKKKKKKKKSTAPSDAKEALPERQSRVRVGDVDEGDLRSSLRAFRQRTKSQSPEMPPQVASAPAKVTTLPPPPKKKKNDDDDDLPPPPL